MEGWKRLFWIPTLIPTVLSTVAGEAALPGSVMLSEPLHPTPRHTNEEADMATKTFDPIHFKETTRAQWQNTAKAWNDWGGRLST